MAISKLAKRRLTTLIEYMATLKVANGHFKMRHWAAHKGKPVMVDVHGITETEKVDKKHLLECGMTACAAGWACTIPAFQRAGLMMRIDKDGYNTLRPVYRDEQHFNAITKFFDIDEKRARRLFGFTLAISSPAAWAKRARPIVKQWEKADVR